ncbi:hypothetical protein [Tenggerimyces flavus]|uniref:DUF1772 domain-containing protein n=1 Tax=Tenggerimyces flavus TaxID=1708749 RepID=A0ABV7Y535_9ACTN|nr:hypothetical protein [Tenggerimyces flavus]MBM7790076.1 hypothetical protein [Tenggerimyces flavus]
MEPVIHILGALLVILALVPALAHALELPGKRRLEPGEYVSVQRIYYPGFTVIGAAEPLAIVAMLVSALVTPAGTDNRLRWFALLAVGAAHAVYWIRVHRINQVWLRDERLTAAGSAFFGAGPRVDLDEATFVRSRRQWERGHVARAVLTGAATIAVLIALA